MPKINPQNVRILRTTLQWSLDRLASEAKVNRQTIYRIEAGKTKAIRSHTIQALAKALNTNVDSLTGPDLSVVKSVSPELGGKSQLNVRISNDTRNSLALVCLRYGIKPSLVVESAPLLFYYIAEMSLKQRQGKLNDFITQLMALRDSGLGHVRIDALEYPDVERALSLEQRSIDQKDIFGIIAADQYQSHVDYGFDVSNGEDNPLKAFVSGLLDDIEGAELSGFWKDYGVSYIIGQEEALSLLDNCEKAADYVINGIVLLHEAPKALLNSSKGALLKDWVLDQGKIWEDSRPPVDINALINDMMNMPLPDARESI